MPPVTVILWDGDTDFAAILRVYPGHIAVIPIEGGALRRARMHQASGAALIVLAGDRGSIPVEDGRELLALDALFVDVPDIQDLRLPAVRELVDAEIKAVVQPRSRQRVVSKREVVPHLPRKFRRARSSLPV